MVWSAPVHWFASAPPTPCFDQNQTSTLCLINWLTWETGPDPLPTPQPLPRPPQTSIALKFSGGLEEGEVLPPWLTAME